MQLYVCGSLILLWEVGLLYFRYWLLVICILFSASFLPVVPARAGGVVYFDQMLKHLMGDNAVCRKAAAEKISKLIWNTDGGCPASLKIKIKEGVSVKKLLKLLEHEDAAFRLSAVMALGKMGDASAVLPLMKALKDEDGRVRASAAYRLGDLGDKRAVPSLIAQYNDKDVRVRRILINAIARLAGKAVIPVALKALGDEEAEVRVEAANTYLAYVGADAVLPLIALLRDKNEDVASSIAASLTRVSYKEKVQLLLKALGEIKGERRKLVFQALGTAVNEQTLRAAEEIIRDKTISSNVREDAINYLIGVADKAEDRVLEILAPVFYDFDFPSNAFFPIELIKSRKVVAYMMENYKKFDPRVHYYVVSVIGREAVSGNVDAKKFLLEILKSKAEDNDVRRLAAQKLGEAKAEEAIPALWDLFFEDRDVSSSDAAVIALATFGNDRILNKFIELLKSDNENFKYMAITGLSRIENEEAVPALLQMLKDKNPKIRMQTLKLLYPFADPIINRARFALLDDKDPEVRRVAISVLSSLTSKDFSMKLTRMLKDRNAEVRADAVHSLRDLAMQSVPGSIEGLVAGLKNDDAAIRKSAFDGLKMMGRINVPAALVLIKAYQKADDQLKVKIIDLLAHYRTDRVVSELERIARDEKKDLKKRALAVLKTGRGAEGGVSLLCLREINDLSYGR